MIRILAAMLVFLPAPLLAQEIFPALYDVTSVAADDVLNVRADPVASAEKIGSFPPDATDIEVIELSGGGYWGHVNLAETTGWVSMGYLVRQPGQTPEDWSTGLAPRRLDCSGNEPFWSLTLPVTGPLTFTDPFDGDGSAQSGGFVAISRSASTGKRGFQGWLDGSPTGLTGIVSREICSDGMSDQDYGLAIDLVRQTPYELRLDAGCCSLVP